MQDHDQARCEFGRDRQSLHEMQPGAVLMAIVNTGHYFTLTPKAHEVVNDISHGMKSRKVSAAIIKYGDDAELSLSGRKHYEAIIGQLNTRIMELEKKFSSRRKSTLWERILGHRGG